MAAKAAANQMQKMVGRRLSLPLRPTDRPTDRGTSAKSEGLVGGRAMDVILACLPPTRPPTSPILLPSFVLPFHFSSDLSLLLFLLLLLLDRFLPVFRLFADSLAGPAHWRRSQQQNERQRYLEYFKAAMHYGHMHPHAQSIFL